MIEIKAGNGQENWSEFATITLLWINMYIAKWYKQLHWWKEKREKGHTLTENGSHDLGGKRHLWTDA